MKIIARALTTGSRRVAVLLLAVGLLAVTAGAWFVVDRDRAHVRTTDAHIPAASLRDFSALDCPLRQRCQPGAPAATLGREATVSAARHYFPSATVVDHWGVRDDAGALISEYLTLQTPDQVIVEVVSRCVPGGAAVPGTPMTTPPPTMSPRAGATASVVVSGRAGCGVAVIVDTLTGQTLPRAAADALAHDPALPLP